MKSDDESVPSVSSSPSSTLTVASSSATKCSSVTSSNGVSSNGSSSSVVVARMKGITDLDVDIIFFSILHLVSCLSIS